jgi:glycosyltransferase involved in cell wall biosynthesis
MQTNKLDKVVLVIPSYKPPQDLPQLIKHLQNNGFNKIVLVDDGSPEEFQSIFNQVTGVHLIHLQPNMGKGAALKKAYEYISKNISGHDYVICSDDDGQHHPDDTYKVALAAVTKTNRGVFLGSRQFEGSVPIKSIIGNVFMRFTMRLVTGKKIIDTQTGLRCLPIEIFSELNEIPHDRFNFELVSLLCYIKKGYVIYEIPIRTIYFNQNQASRFRGIRDSFSVISSLLIYLFRK